MSKPSMLALEDELAAYFARSGFLAVEVDDLPDGSAIPPIDLEDIDPARLAKGSGQIAVASMPADVDARVAAIAIPRLSTAEIEALRLHVVPSVAEVGVDVDLEFDLAEADVEDLTEHVIGEDAAAVLAEAWGPPPVARRRVTIPPFDAGPAVITDSPRRDAPITIPPLVYPHATLDIRAATRIVVGQRLERVDLVGDRVAIPWLAPVAISDSTEDEVSISVLIYDAQLEVPV